MRWLTVVRRDFMDIKQVNDLGLMTAPQCWDLWTKKNPGETVDAAKQKVLFHLTSLEGRRPLESGHRRTRTSPPEAGMVQAGVSQAMTEMPLDHSVYPDLDELPTVLESLEAKADYVHRICSAWDYGVHPDRETFVLFAGWKEVFDRYPVLTSPAYHAFCAWFGWKAKPYPPGVLAPTPRWVHLDRLEGRDADPCEHMI